MRIECPECGAEIILNEKPMLNEIFECPECGALLVVKEVEPNIEIEVVDEVDEDWGE